MVIPKLICESRVTGTLVIIPSGDPLLWLAAVQLPSQLRTSFIGTDIPTCTSCCATFYYLDIVSCAPSRRLTCIRARECRIPVVVLTLVCLGRESPLASRLPSFPLGQILEWWRRRERQPTASHDANPYRMLFVRHADAAAVVGRPLDCQASNENDESYTASYAILYTTAGL